jgi:creatinine amidohydrolase
MKTKNQNQNNSKDSPVQQLEELSWKQIEQLDHEKTIFFLPISPLEEHGPHLPVGTDFLVARDAVKEAIKILQKTKPELTYIMMPAIPVGYAHLGSDFPGTISSDGKTVRNIIYSICSSLGAHGFRYVLICSYHMELGHLKGIYQGMEKAARKYGMKIYEPQGPYHFNKEVEKREPRLGFDTQKEVHGCFRETSLMKYQYPYLVDESYKTLQSIYIDLTSPRVLGKTFKELGIKDGYVGSPARADADYGRWFFQETVDLFVRSALDLQQGKTMPQLPAKIKLLMKSPFKV